MVFIAHKGKAPGPRAARDSAVAAARPAPMLLPPAYREASAVLAGWCWPSDCGTVRVPPALPCLTLVVTSVGGPRRLQCPVHPLEFRFGWLSSTPYDECQIGITPPARPSGPLPGRSQCPGLGQKPGARRSVQVSTW